jgi:hypothetical protein
MNMVFRRLIIHVRNITATATEVRSSILITRYRTHNIRITGRNGAK